MRRRFNRRNRVGLAAALVAAVLLLNGPATTRLSLPNGRNYEVLAYDRRHVYIVDPRTHAKRVEDQLRLRYYAQVTGPDLMRREAVLLADAVLAVADSVGLSIAVIEPARPVLARFTRITTTYPVRFERDSSRHWRRVQ